MRRRLILTVIVTCLLALTLGACKSTTGEEPEPDTTQELAVSGPAEARDAALDYLREHYQEPIPGEKTTWQEQDTTPPGFVGSADRYFVSPDWTIGISYPVVRPDLTVYTVVLTSTMLGLHWEGTVNADGTVTEKSPLIQMTEALEDKVWVLESYGDTGNLKAVLEDIEITIEFVSADSKVAGSAGCNTYFAGYEVEGSKLTIVKPIGTTLMSCPEPIMNQEREYLSIFEVVEAYVIEDGQLSITAGDKLLVFKYPEPLEISCDEFMDNHHIARNVEVNVGEIIIVVLCSNPSTGFQWTETAEIGDQAILQQQDHVYIAPKSDVPGAAGKERWAFRALKKGTTEVSMEYSRPWEGGEKGEWTFNLTVLVK